MIAAEALDAGLRAAMRAGLEVKGLTRPNPPVGAVILGEAGDIIATGATRPAGQEHAEVIALRAAGDNARGATAVVTLEPCNHTGRTGPCTEALLAAGIKRVCYLHADPNPVAAGGAKALAEAGVEVLQLSPPDGEEDALVAWLYAVRNDRPHVTVKFAQTIDGFSAATDGTSQWITGEIARDYVHADRARRDAIIIGTGTALADNPSLTARYRDGSLRGNQPVRVVIGTRDLAAAGPAAANLLELGFEQFPDIDTALSSLYKDGARDVLVEGGAGLASAFLNLGYVDAIQVYLAPVLLGEGRGVLAHPIAHTLADAPRFHRTSTKVLGEDVLIEYVR